MNELTIKIAGEAGQGIETVGEILCRISKAKGFSIFSNLDYMSRIRGGNNFFQLRISNAVLYALRQNSDITVALDKASVDLHKTYVATGGILMLDRKKFNITEENSSFFDVPIYDIASRAGGSELFVNSVSCGCLTNLMEIEFSYVEEILKRVFMDKGKEAVKKNIEAALAGFDFVQKNFGLDKFKVKPGELKESLLMNGNDAIALGAIRAGCKFYSAYPMSPSTTIMNTIARFSDRFNIVVEQAEDEIAAINMIIGASFAGVRSMAATSGGGFALMVEGVSLAAMTENPIVIVVAQRPAPATGFPTRTEQADLDFLLSAGHGEFARVIYSPGTIEEAFYLTIRAFNIAEKYQIPVLIMTDQHMADSNRDIDIFDLDKIKVERFIISKEGSKAITNYKRYLFTDSGISPRAVPSWIEDVIYVDSDEHTELGHITEEAGIRMKMVEKRFYKKMRGLSDEIETPVVYNLENADMILLGFGSSFGVIREIATYKDKRIGSIHLPQVWPFPAEKLSELLKAAKKILTVENNAGAQLAKLIRRETGIKVHNSILKFDGRPFNVDYLLDEIEKAGKS